MTDKKNIIFDFQKRKFQTPSLTFISWSLQYDADHDHPNSQGAEVHICQSNLSNMLVK